jgi:hypothetical protein
MNLRYSVVLLSFLAGLTGNAAVITYDFEDVPLGTVSSFIDPKGGVVATFSSTSDLHVYQNAGTFLLPPFMGHAVSNGTGFPINITFSASLESASLDFGTNNLAGVSFAVSLQAYRGGPGGVLLATTSTLGILPGGSSSFPQGTASISAAGFDTLVVSGAQPGLAIDNVTISSVPEPGSIYVFIGLSGLLCLENARKGYGRRNNLR